MGVGCGRSGVGGGSSGDGRHILSVYCVGLGNGGGGISSGADGVCCPGSGVPAGGGCDVIRGCSDSGHMANGSGHIVGKVLDRVGVLGGGGSPFRVVGT
eukprot:g14808.t1